MIIRDLLELLEKKDLLFRVRREVDRRFELPTIMKMLDGSPVIFESVKGTDMPVVGNLCSSRDLVSMGLGIKRADLTRHLLGSIENPEEPATVDGTEYVEREANLDSIPIPTYYPFDGGPYVTSGIVVAEDPEFGLNASYHRGMVISGDRIVFRILQRDFDSYIERGLTDFAYCIGNPVSVLVAAAVSEDISVSELSIANSLRPISLVRLEGHLVPRSEIVLLMRLTGEEHGEGPFLDLTETPDIERPQRVAVVEKVFVMENPRFHALLPGGREHKTLMGMPREATIFREVSKVCEVEDVLVTDGGCSWLHGAVKIRRRREEDPRNAIEAAFKGHRSMKHVFIVDEDIDIHRSDEIEWAMATRFQGDRDVITRRERGSSLDPSSDPETHVTTKMGFDLTIPWGRDPADFKRPEFPMEIDLDDYLSE